jgi:hypothetical protein
MARADCRRSSRCTPTSAVLESLTECRSAANPSQLRSHEWSSGAFHTEELELLPSEMDVAPEFDGNDELDDDTFY